MALTQIRKTVLILRKNENFQARSWEGSGRDIRLNLFSFTQLDVAVEPKIGFYERLGEGQTASSFTNNFIVVVNSAG